MYNEAWQPVQQLIPNIKLEDYQCATALSIATEERQLVLFETGLGKTLATIAGLIMRKNAGKTRKLLWLSPLDVLPQTRSVFSTYTSMRGHSVTGTSREMSRWDYSSLDITYMNFEAFDERDVLEWVMNMYTEFDTVVVDEAHLIANPFSSNRNGFLWWLVSKIPSRFLLTATPTISRIDQYASLLCLLEGSLKDLLKYRSQIHMKQWTPDQHPRLLSYKKRDVTIPMDVLLYEEPIQRSRNIGMAMFKDTRGCGAEKPYTMLLDLIRKNNLRHFLVYANITDHHQPLVDFLKENTDLRVGILSGKTRNKSSVQKSFNEGELDVLVYSTTTGRDLPAESVIFFEWDVYAAQSLGRALRSKHIEKDFHVWFLINTLYETEMFENTVVKTGILNEKALNKNIFKKIGGLS